MKGHSSGERELQGGTADNGAWEEAQQGAFPVFWPWTVLRKSGRSSSPVMTCVALARLLNLCFNTRLRGRAAPVALLPGAACPGAPGGAAASGQGHGRVPSMFPNVKGLLGAVLVDK